MKLTATERSRFAVDGYVVVPSLVSQAWRARVDAEIDQHVANNPPPAAAEGTDCSLFARAQQQRQHNTQDPTLFVLPVERDRKR